MLNKKHLMVIKVLLRPKGDVKACQASGRAAAVKSTADLGILGSKPLAGWMLFGRFVLQGIKQFKTLMFWRLQPPGCSGAGETERGIQ